MSQKMLKDYDPIDVRESSCLDPKSNCLIGNENNNNKNITKENIPLVRKLSPFSMHKMLRTIFSCLGQELFNDLTNTSWHLLSV